MLWLPQPVIGAHHALGVLWMLAPFLKTPRAVHAHLRADLARSRTVGGSVGLRADPAAGVDDGEGDGVALAAVGGGEADVEDALGDAERGGGEEGAQAERRERMMLPFKVVVQICRF